MQKPIVIAIVGPTCSGKTALSLELAPLVRGHIIACDSRTIYKEMDIGTAKPNKTERDAVPHYMLDVVFPNEPYTVSEYVNGARQSIIDIYNEGAIPIICGGTGFYTRALLEGIKMPDVSPQPELRAELESFAEQYGNEALYKKLEQEDLRWASKLNTNDRFRIIRALEVMAVLGRPMSEAAGRGEPDYDVLWIGLNAHDRQYIYDLIEQRMQILLKAGLIDEVQYLLSKYGPEPTLKNTVNYKEFLPLIEGQALRQDCLELCLKNNRNLVRKQLIWFRALENITWFEIDTQDKNMLLSRVYEHVKNKLDAAKV